MTVSLQAMEVHRCRFIDYQPAKINALSFTPETSGLIFLACGRSNGSIEIWNLNGKWNMEKVACRWMPCSTYMICWPHAHHDTVTILRCRLYRETITCPLRVLYSPTR